MNNAVVGTYVSFNQHAGLHAAGLLAAGLLNAGLLNYDA